MRSSTLLTTCAALLGVAHAAAVEKRDLLQDLQSQAMEALKIAESGSVATRGARCTLENASVRKDWYESHPPPNVHCLTPI